MNKRKGRIRRAGERLMVTDDEFVAGEKRERDLVASLDTWSLSETDNNPLRAGSLLY